MFRSSFFEPAMFFYHTFIYSLDSPYLSLSLLSFSLFRHKFAVVGWNLEHLEQSFGFFFGCYFITTSFAVGPQLFETSVISCNFRRTPCKSCLTVMTDVEGLY